MKKTLLVMTMVIALSISMVGAGLASSTIYDTIPDPLPSNVAGLSYGATQTAEFGQRVNLDAEATADSVTVVMSSWACADGAIWTAGCGEVPEDNETFTLPITVNIYEDGDGAVDSEPGQPLKTVTQDVAVPFRPAADASCADEDGRAATDWRDEAGDCFAGYAFTASFDLGGTTLPTDFIYSVAFDRTGPAAGSLNLGLEAGGDLLNYWDSTYLNREPGLRSIAWGYNILARFEVAPVELTADDCKNGGFGDLGFRNQGQCIASFNANENAGK